MKESIDNYHIKNPMLLAWDKRKKNSKTGFLYNMDDNQLVSIETLEKEMQSAMVQKDGQSYEQYCDNTLKHTFILQHYSTSKNVPFAQIRNKIVLENRDRRLSIVGCQLRNIDGIAE